MFKRLANNIKGKHLKIVFPEANDKRVLGAAVRLRVDDLVEPILLGNVEEVKALAAQNSWNIDAFTIIDPETYVDYDAMVAAFVERRKGKATEEQARDLLKDVSYFGTMLVYMGLADGLVSGAVHSTGDTVRPALQIIKTKPGITRTSGAFIMVPAESDGQKLVFADCAININPSPQELAEIAVESAHTAKIFDIEPRVAMLSFSTKGSAKHEVVDKVVEATRIAKEMYPNLQVDGELQADAALVPSVGTKKAPGSNIAGKANVLIAPNLEVGNIGYKLVQRLGKAEALGPILQGIARPVNDLSRGCSVEDIYKMVAITANQAIAAKAEK